MTTVRDIATYEEVVWLDQVPDLASCYQASQLTDSPDAEGADVSTWLQINDQELPKPPVPPAELTPWLKQQEFEQARRDPPKLQPQATIEDPHWDSKDSDEPTKVTIRLADRPGVEELYQTYCTIWHQWATELGDSLRAQELYSKLYQIHRRLDREGETLQLCVGFGLLDWQKPGGKAAKIRRHVVTATAELEFDPKLGAMRVSCPSEGTNVSLERDMLDREFDPPQSQTAEVEATLASIGSDDAVWDRDRMHAALQTWGRLLDPKTRWSPALSAEEGRDAVPALTWAPAVILRKRGSTALLRLYEKIIQQLRSSGILPAGWASLVEVTSDAAPHESNDPRSPNYWPDEGSEIYFPLPANAQQREIVGAIRTRRGVVVQGPPGTGKSHTIANLMCHLLASGQRVLVTAENPRALAVLRDKLPPELQPLCVSVLGQGGDAFEALSKTVREISSRRALWSEEQGQEQIASLQRQLLEAKRALEDLDREHRDIRLGETQKHNPAPGYHGTPQGIASKVSEQRGDYDWLDLGDSDAAEAPLRNAEATRWLELQRSSNPDEEAELDDLLIPLEELPPSTEVEDLIATSVERKRRRDEFVAEATTPGFNALLRFPESDLRRLREQLEHLRNAWTDLPSASWCREAARITRIGDLGGWQVLLQRTGESLQHVDQLSDRLGQRRVDVPADLAPEQVRDDAQVVLEHLNAGGKWKRMLGLGRPRAVRGREYLIDKVRVDASPADEPHELEGVIHAMNRRITINQLAQAWVPHTRPSADSDAETVLAHIRMWADHLRSSIAVGNLDRELRIRIQSQLDIALPEDWMAARERDWLRVIDAARSELELMKAEQRIESLARQIGAKAQLHDASPRILEMYAAIQRRDVSSYGKAREVVARLWQRRRIRDERQGLDARMAQLAKPLRDAVISTLNHPAWSQRLAIFEEAWTWHVSDRWLRRFSDPGRLMTVERERRRADSRVRSLITQLAAHLAWQKFFQRLEPKQDMALKSWLDTVKRMGKGKGRSAKLERLRRQARAHLEDCRDAIPAWVMPRYLVAEMVSVAPELFDTVIVDEASQMGLDGMFVFYVGRRTVIVGDDQQISPSDVGMRDEEIAELQRQNIPDFEHVNAMGLGGNVYANAQIRFSRLITLREHFRCMPEIIQFSNDLCYASQGTPLDPMRSYRDDRLPPLVAKRVAGGQREGDTNPTNRIEAQEIVNHIAQCLDDPRYDGKTFGVISLVGSNQARLIESLLLDRFDPGTIEERRILCGDAYTFQGDERHVIFLSMVVSRGETRLTAQTSQSAVQRFNVAVSRAQDQLIVYHSVDPQDLKPECMRHRLLTHAINPVRRPLQGEDHEFESPFEEAVFKRIIERGHRVETQVKVGSHATYRIDLVVHGIDSKLAVECDGDRWHGPERFDADMARQRDLERVGWEFVRIAGSAFYRDPDAALEPLWAALEERKIRPATAEPIDAPAPPKPEPPERNELPSIKPATAPSLAPFTQVAGPAAQHLLFSESLGGAELPSQLRAAAAIAPQDETASMLADTFPDPRGANSQEVKATLLALLKRHGPIPRDYLMRRYARGANIGRLGRVVRESLGRVIQSATRSGEIVSQDEMELHGSDPILRSAGTDAVRRRQIGDREFEEVPPSEWAQTMLDLCGGRDGLRRTSRDEAFRRALAHYQLTSLTQNRRHILDRALQLALRAE
ncbi:MAG: AAA family ATPase [Planctomycetes bacterium]|nr:AAA family ATPase [Planctomycetota bacterium]